MCSTRRVPPVTTELIGCGLMEWSRERDRYLNVSEGALCHHARYLSIWLHLVVPSIEVVGCRLKLSIEVPSIEVD